MPLSEASTICALSSTIAARAPSLDRAAFCGTPPSSADVYPKEDAEEPVRRPDQSSIPAEEINSALSAPDANTIRSGVPKRDASEDCCGWDGSFQFTVMTPPSFDVPTANCREGWRNAVER